MNPTVDRTLDWNAIADRIPTELAGRQPDLRVPFAQKRDIFREVIGGLKDLPVEHDRVADNHAGIPDAGGGLCRSGGGVHLPL